MSAIVGGTASELGGGKFANGAVTAAFVTMYNEMGHTYPSRDNMLKVDPKQLRAMRVLAVMERSQRFPIRGISPLGYSEANEVVSAMERLNGKVLDGVGLALSVGASVAPASIAIRLAGTALVIDFIQGDVGGILTGGLSMRYPSYGTVAADIGYGIYQVYKEGD